jgi:hypothetical protein
LLARSVSLLSFAPFACRISMSDVHKVATEGFGDGKGSLYDRYSSKCCHSCDIVSSCAQITSQLPAPITPDYPRPCSRQCSAKRSRVSPRCSLAVWLIPDLHHKTCSSTWRVGHCVPKLSSKPRFIPVGHGHFHPRTACPSIVGGRSRRASLY